MHLLSEIMLVQLAVITGARTATAPRQGPKHTVLVDVDLLVIAKHLAVRRLAPVVCLKGVRDGCCVLPLDLLIVLHVQIRIVRIGDVNFDIVTGRVRGPPTKEAGIIVIPHGTADIGFLGGIGRALYVFLIRRLLLGIIRNRACILHQNVVLLGAYLPVKTVDVIHQFVARVPNTALNDTLRFVENAVLLRLCIVRGILTALILALVFIPLTIIRRFILVALILDRIPAAVILPLVLVPPALILLVVQSLLLGAQVIVQLQHFA